MGQGTAPRGPARARSGASLTVCEPLAVATSRASRCPCPRTNSEVAAASRALRCPCCSGPSFQGTGKPLRGSAAGRDHEDVALPLRSRGGRMPRLPGRRVALASCPLRPDSGDAATSRASRSRYTRTVLPTSSPLPRRGAAHDTVAFGTNGEVSASKARSSRVERDRVGPSLRLRFQGAEQPSPGTGG